MDIVSLSQHAILHKKGEGRSRLKGQTVEAKAEHINVPNVHVAPITSSSINRTLEGTRRESRLKVIVWNQVLLDEQDQIELRGDPNHPGTIGTMYEIVEVESDLNDMANHVAYIVRRKQDQPT